MRAACRRRARARRCAPRDLCFLTGEILLPEPQAGSVGTPAHELAGRALQAMMDTRAATLAKNHEAISANLQSLSDLTNKKSDAVVAKQSKAAEKRDAALSERVQKVRGPAGRQRQAPLALLCVPPAGSLGGTSSANDIICLSTPASHLACAPRPGAHRGCEVRPGPRVKGRGELPDAKNCASALRGVALCSHGCFSPAGRDEAAQGAL